MLLRRQLLPRLLAPRLAWREDDTILNLPITLWKGKCSCTQCPVLVVVIYEHLLASYRAFMAIITPVTIPSSIAKALTQPGWKNAIDEEM